MSLEDVQRYLVEDKEEEAAAQVRATQSVWAVSISAGLVFAGSGSGCEGLELFGRFGRADRFDAARRAAPQ